MRFMVLSSLSRICSNSAHSSTPKGASNACCHDRRKALLKHIPTTSCQKLRHRNPYAQTEPVGRQNFKKAAGAIELDTRSFYPSINKPANRLCSNPTHPCICGIRFPRHMPPPPSVVLSVSPRRYSYKYLLSLITLHAAIILRPHIKSILGSDEYLIINSCVSLRDS